MDYTSDTDYFQQCKYIHEVELANMKLQMHILETHLEPTVYKFEFWKLELDNRSSFNEAEDVPVILAIMVVNGLIVESQKALNEEDLIVPKHHNSCPTNSYCRRSTSYTMRNQILKGISVLSLDFGALREENLRLKYALSQAHKNMRMAQLTETDEDYESDIPSSEERFRISPQPKDGFNPYEKIARSIIDDGHLKKLKRYAKELKDEKDELRQLALDTKEAFSVCMAEVQMMLESKTTDFFRVLVDRYKAEMEKRKQLHNKLVEINGNIRVFFRIRPQLEKNFEPAAIQIDELDNGIVYLTHPGGKKSSESADLVIPTDYSQQQGPSSNPGINQRAIKQLFEAVNERNGDIKYSIQISMMEIYNEKIRDLLKPTNNSLLTRLGEDAKLSIPGLKTVTVSSIEHMGEILQQGRKNKV
uniref:Kinesin motor domain-containing protein n=1 Tax=Heterorhabditis bacteriophora TaxID=37862 RepID=A0A1I7XQN3_HETBA